MVLRHGVVFVSFDELRDAVLAAPRDHGPPAAAQPRLGQIAADARGAAGDEPDWRVSLWGFAHRGTPGLAVGLPRAAERPFMSRRRHLAQVRSPPHARS